MKLKADMTVSEATDIIAAAEGKVWDEYFDKFVQIAGSYNVKKNITLEETSPRGGFIVFVERGSSEGIYLNVKGFAEDGKLNHIFTGKTLRSPEDDEAWDACWLSAGRIARALDDVWW